MKPAQEFLAVCRLEGPVEEDFVLLFHFVSRVSEGEGEVTIVGDDEKAFALFIQTTDVVYARPVVGDEVENGPPTCFVGGRADETFRFVDDGMDMLLGFDDAIPDLYDVPSSDGG
jgi:hypothetical protein